MPALWSLANGVQIMCNVLKAPSHLRYQLAYLTSELREIFSNAPLSNADKNLGCKGSNRKQLDGDCPICFMEFSPDDETVYCKSSCGNNVHKQCFQQWIAAQAGREIRCVYWYERPFFEASTANQDFLVAPRGNAMMKLAR